MSCSGCKQVVTVAKGYAYLMFGVNEKLSKQRMKVCRNCPKFNSDGSCSICGCDMAAKTRLPQEQCPDKKPKWLRAA